MNNNFCAHTHSYLINILYVSKSERERKREKTIEPNHLFQLKKTKFIEICCN